MCGGVCCRQPLRWERLLLVCLVGRAQGLTLNILLIVHKMEPTHPKEPPGPKCP